MTPAPLDIPALLTRQADLQLLGNMPTPTPTALRIAYLTEVGELAQEMKHTWAWWKKPGDRPVRSERILSELADVLHFWLLIALREGWRMEGKQLEVTRRNAAVRPDTLLDSLYGPVHWWTPRTLCEIASRYGYTPQDLADAYWAKTEENLRRWGVRV